MVNYKIGLRQHLYLQAVWLCYELACHSSVRLKHERSSIIEICHYLVLVVLQLVYTE